MVLPVRTSSCPSVSADPLAPLLQDGARRARALGRPVLVSYAEPIPVVDPLAVYATARPDTVRLFWHHQDRLVDGAPGQALAGIGVAHSIEARGAGRFDAVKKAWHDLRLGAIVETATGEAPAWGCGPVLLGGFSFDPERPSTPAWRGFADARFTLPRFTVAGAQGRAWLTTNAVVDGDEDCPALVQHTLVERRALLDRAHAAGPARSAATNPPASIRTAQPVHAAAPARQAATRETPVPDPSESTGQRVMDRRVPDLDETPVPVDALPGTAWQAIVERTAGEIREGRFAKVVLARQARVTAPDAPFDASATLAELRSTYPGGFVFAFTFPVAGADRTFLGATPERLVRLHHGIVETSSLAGSIRRGATPEEDAALGVQLLNDEKERTEHAVVAEMLSDALAPLCRGLSVPSAPTLLRLATVQHLFTPIRGALRNGQTVLDLVERLHPTPAVGGFPRFEALAAIRDREQLDRGWYAGPVGWLDGEGDGEFAVAIRSALLDASGCDALLFAGCGIVGHSNPAAEYAESRLKMQAMLSALR